MKRILSTIFILFLFTPAVWAQNITITGTITDADTKSPIAGANITVKGKLAGAITNSEGKFQLITNSSLPLKLIVSFIGYQKQEIEVTNDGQDLSINLSP